MKIIKDAIAGTLESSDLQITVSPQKKLDIIIESDVMPQFGSQIMAVVNETLHKLEINEGLIIIKDKGALDCAIRARLSTAILRGAAIDELDWSVL